MGIFDKHIAEFRASALGEFSDSAPWELTQACPWKPGRAPFRYCVVDNSWKTFASVVL